MSRRSVRSIHPSATPQHCACVAVITLLAACGMAGAAQVVSFYTGPGKGSWSTAGNWTPFGVPNNGGGTTYYVIIDGAGGTGQDSVVVLDSPRTIDAMEIYAGDELRIPNGQALAIVGGAIQNMNRMSMLAGPNGTDLRIGASVLLSGDGELVMSDSINNVVRNNFGAVEWLTHGANHTIRGAGQLGADSIFLANHGVIQADQPTELQVNLRSEEQNRNFGTLQAADGATLRLYHSGTILNDFGFIRALDASTVILEGTHILHGTLTTEGSGQVVTNSTTPYLEDVQNAGLFRLPNGQTVAVSGMLTNDATIRMDAGVNGTEFRIHTAEFLLTGSGQMSLSDSINNLIRNNFGPVTRLVHDGTHTIRGSGQFGADSLFLTNAGLIQADQSTELQLNLRNEEVNVNDGVMQATGGATLRLYHSGTIDNADGVIRALDGSTVILEGTHVLMGTLTTEGSGQVITNSTTPHLEDLLNSGLFRVPNAQTVAVSGMLTNDATIRMDAGVNGTEFRIHTAEFLLTGSGQMSLSDSINNLIRNNFGPVTRLVHDGTHTIRGSGQFGADSLFLTNEGLIQADQSNELQLNLRNEEVNVNDGVMQATGGATLRLYHSGTIDNADGVIRALDGSTVILEGTHILMGTLTTEGSGQVITNSTTPHLEDVINDGLLAIPNAQTMAVSGAIVNDGTLRMDAGPNGTEFRVNSEEFHLAGLGEMVLSDSANNNIRNNLGAVTHFVNDAGHTIRGSGNVGQSSLQITNLGSIIADSSTGLLIDPFDSAGFNNEGSIHVTGTGSATLTWGGFTTSGTVLVDAGRTLTRNGDYTQTGGITTVNGALQVNSGSVQLNGGTLGGTGTINGAVNNTGGVVSPGNSAGTLTINGGYQQSAGGMYAVELGGFAPSQSDFLSINGSAQLNGVLAVDLAPGFNPLPGTEFVVLQTTGGTVTGQFTQILPCRFIATYSATSVKLTVGTTVLADINCDGVVDGNDLAILLGAWGLCASPACPADLNRDGIVDGNDLAILLGAWG